MALIIIGHQLSIKGIKDNKSFEMMAKASHLAKEVTFFPQFPSRFVNNHSMHSFWALLSTHESNDLKWAKNFISTGGPGPYYFFGSSIVRSIYIACAVPFIRSSLQRKSACGCALLIITSFSHRQSLSIWDASCVA